MEIAALEGDVVRQGLDRGRASAELDELVHVDAVLRRDLDPDEPVVVRAGRRDERWDRDERPGKKFADAELLGIPYRVVVSSKTVSGVGCELKARTSETVEQISIENLIKKLTA